MSTPRSLSISHCIFLFFVCEPMGGGGSLTLKPKAREDKENPGPTPTPRINTPNYLPTKTDRYKMCVKQYAGLKPTPADANDQ